MLAVAYFFYALQPVAANQNGGQGNQGAGEVREFKIAKGDGFRDIASRLSRESLIRSIGVFKAYTLLTGKAQRFQPGIYELHGGMSVPDIVQTLTRGGKNEIVVTVPEGSTVRDIAALLQSAGVVSDESLAFYAPALLSDRYPFLAQRTSLEGFLFPDTYRFQPGSSNEDVLTVLLDTFEKKAWPLLQGSKRDWYETLILASFLEREVPEFTDRTIVAGILVKRLDQKIPLQIDATISYAKCEGQLRGCASIRVARSDLSLSSPYNTYQHLGWTPAPISNPGQSAIQAARDPLPSPYWYYLSASSTKETMFSKTLDEHNIKRAKYL